MANKKDARIRHLIGQLNRLTDRQIFWVESIVQRMIAPKQYKLEDSDLFDMCMLEAFGDALLIHHCFSTEAFSKDKFEYVLEAVSNLCGKPAQIAPKGTPGHDITIAAQRFSLKTEAAKSIREDELHISKFMELGKGEWADDPKHLDGLRRQFLDHLDSYDRILSLRTLSKAPLNWRYELAEISKPLLGSAENGELEMKSNSTQMPKPGYCHVRTQSGELQFQLYFDGGGERKLQIKHLLKSLCRVHAKWEFPPIELYADRK